MAEHDDFLKIPPDQLAELPVEVFMRLWNDKKFLHTYMQAWDKSVEHCTAEMPNSTYFDGYAVNDF